MRLLESQNDGTFRLTNRFLNNLPPYAILSHTWGTESEEVTFKDMSDNSGQGKLGYRKLRFCGEQAAKDKLRYFWVDTCCINKPNQTELSEDIVSMFRYYRRAAICYVYLSDVSIGEHNNNDQSQPTWELAFRKSRWFTRGWTLQELLAPQSVEFFSQEGEHLGNKKLLERQIHEITRIPVEALRGSPLSNFSVDERMSWAAKRETTRKEDKAYSLLGIFDVYMTFIYGEGDNAFSRLEEAIQNSLKRKSRASIAWQARHGMTSSVYQGTSDKLAKEGYRLTYVSCYTFNDDPRFAAIWKAIGTATDTTNWVARHGMTSDEYQEQFNALVANGFRLNLINGYNVAGEALYAAIWDKSTSTPWVARHGMTSSEYQAAFNAYCSQGYRLRHISGYAQGGQALYAALWDKSGTDIAWVSTHGVTSRTYQSLFDDYTEEGFRLVHVSSYVVNNKVYYAGIWDKSLTGWWIARHGLSADEYRIESDKWLESGYRLALVSGCTVDSIYDLYAALWIKDE